jgi:TonB family protein
MSTLESWIVLYLFNSIWQLPLIFAAACIVACFMRPISPRAEHRVWVAALIAEIILPMCHLSLSRLWQQVSAFLACTWAGNAGRGEARVIIGPGTTLGTSLLRLPSATLTAIAIAYACIVLYFLGRLAFGLWRTAVMRREAHALTLFGDLATKFNLCRSQFALDANTFAVATSPIVSGPVTVGFRRALLLFPPGFVDRVSESDFEAVLAHEFAHMQRHDFAKNLLYECLSLAAAYHPMLWLTRSRLAETREIVCDSMAAEVVRGRETYARSLLRLASILSDRSPARTLHAIGIFDANIFERRIMNLAQKPIEITGARRFAITMVCALIAVATCASALAFHVDSVSAAAQTDRPKKIHVKVDNLKILSRKNPIYPPDAKAKKDTLDGPVVLEVIIGKDGVVENIKVKKSLRDDYDRSALDAVKDWRWQPYLLNGEPIEVETDVKVEFFIKG